MSQKQKLKSAVDKLKACPPSEQGRRDPFWNLTDDQRVEMEDVRRAWKDGELKHLTFTTVFREVKQMLDLKCCLTTFKTWMEK